MYYKSAHMKKYPGIFQFSQGYCFSLEMGGTFSESIPRDPSDGLVAIVLRSYDKVRLLHAPRPVLDLTQRISR